MKGLAMEEMQCWTGERRWRDQKENEDQYGAKKMAFVAVFCNTDVGRCIFVKAREKVVIIQKEGESLEGSFRREQMGPVCFLSMSCRKNQTACPKMWTEKKKDLSKKGC